MNLSLCVIRLVQRHSSAFVLLFSSVAAVDAAGADLPPLADRQKAAAAVKDVYGQEIEKAKTPLDKARLALSVQKAAKTEKDAANRWAMLDLARDLAAKAGDAALLKELATDMGRSYGCAAQAYADSLTALASSNRAGFDVVDMLLMCVDAAVDVNDFTAVERGAGAAQGIAERAGDDIAAKYFGYVRRQSGEWGRKYATAKSDPDALARFVFFDKHDITSGIPLLIKCKDPKLAAAAKKDVDVDILSATDTQAAGDAWSQLAAAAGPGDKIALLMAAGYSYGKSIPDLTGLARARAKIHVLQAFEAVDEQQARDGLFLQYAGNWTYQEKSSRLIGGLAKQTESFTVLRSGRILMDQPSGRLYLSRQGRKVVLRQPQALSLWKTYGDSLTIEISTLAGMSVETINANRK